MAAAPLERVTPRAPTLEHQPVEPLCETAQQLRAQRVNDNVPWNGMNASHHSPLEPPLTNLSSSSSTSSSDDDEIVPKANDKPRKKGFGNYPKKTNSAMPPYDRLDIANDQINARGKVSKHDGRLKLSMRKAANTGWLGKAVEARMKHRVTHNEKHDREQQEHEAHDEEKAQRIMSNISAKRDSESQPKMNIVVMVIGSRGDIQPFIKIGKILKDKHGHRVRIATHPAFKDFIEKDCGLEFFSVGGNPSELMAFMVKNPGMIPKFQTFKEGEIGRRRDQMYEMFEGFWRACVQPADGTEPSKKDTQLEPFIADLIIANPPSFAHVHCAERLGCPLHIIFTFPYTPTQQFPHPLVNMKPGDVEEGYTNFMSYPLVEMMTWQGLGDLVNRFRVTMLGLDPVSTLWAPGQLYRMKVPYTYLWSPTLVPKPSDWGPEIDIAGFVFLDLASSFDPPEDLTKFLEAGEPPVYIGFGSIVIDDPDGFTKLIFEAVAKAGVRALVNKGWGGLGDEGNIPDNIYMLDNTPHDWLFPRCKAVVHHGGAGTTAIGLKCAKPTMIVPFFGDQPFWGAMVAEKKAGAFECVPYKDLDADKFAQGIKQCLTDEAQRNVQVIADSIEKEGDGAANAVKSVLSSLPWRGSSSMRCGILEDQTAAWRLKDHPLRLSPLAAEMLVQHKILSYRDMRLLRHYSWNDFQGPGAPLTGVSSGVVRALTGIGKGFAEGPVSMGKDVHKHAAYERKKRLRRKSKSKKNDERKSSGSSTSDGKAGTSEESTSKTEDEYTETEGDASDGKPRTSSQLGDNEKVGRALPESTEKASEVQEDLNDAAAAKNYDPATPPFERADSQLSIVSGAPSGHIVMDLAEHAAKGVVKPLEAIAEAPMEILLGLSQGLHNAPRLYGDTTVRRPHRITGLASGMSAAFSEFTLGTYDALTGIVTQPYHGAKQDGVVGLVTGIGKGLGGLVLKESAAVIAPVAFMMKGVQKQLTKSRTPIATIRAERVRQGQLDVHSLSPAEREESWRKVQGGWEMMARLRRRGEDLKKEGGVIKGAWRSRRERKAWAKYGAAENVEMGGEALEARERDVPFDEFMEGNREESEQGRGRGEEEGGNSR